MPNNQLINMLFMQALWFTAVIGAAHLKTWPTILLLLVFAIWQLMPKHREVGDIQLILVAVFLGILLDSSWIRFDFIEFSNQKPIKHMAPLWILALWAGLALTLNHSLGWLRHRLILAGFMGAVVGPFSYSAAEELGALHFVSGSWYSIGALAVSWGLVMPLLLWLAVQMKKLNREIV